MMKTLLNLLILNVFLHITHGEAPRGHMQPMGSHQDPHHGIPMMGYFPSPGVFYHNFVKTSQPLLLRGAMDHEGAFPAFKKWTDEYFR